MREEFDGLSLSTSWVNNRFATGTELVEKYMEMGFRRMELNYMVTDEMVKDIEDHRQDNWDTYP